MAVYFKSSNSTTLAFACKASVVGINAVDLAAVFKIEPHHEQIISNGLRFSLHDGNQRSVTINDLKIYFFRADQITDSIRKDWNLEKHGIRIDSETVTAHEKDFVDIVQVPVNLKMSINRIQFFMDLKFVKFLESKYNDIDLPLTSDFEVPQVSWSLLTHQVIEAQ